MLFKQCQVGLILINKKIVLWGLLTKWKRSRDSFPILFFCSLFSLNLSNDTPATFELGLIMFITFFISSSMTFRKNNYECFRYLLLNTHYLFNKFMSFHLQLNSLYIERKISRFLSFSPNYVIVCFNIHLSIGIMVYSRIILGTK